MDQVHDFLIGDRTLSSTPMRKKARRLQSLKIASPILPQKDSDSSEPPSKKAKTVAFTDELHTIIPCLPRVEDTTDPEEGAQEATATVIQMFRPLAKAAQDRMAAEKLCELDTTARVPIPAVSPVRAFSPLDSPTETRSLLEKVKQQEKKWSGASKLEKSLPWVPFSSRLAKIRPEGEFDDGSCVRYLKELALDDDLDIDVQRLTWKPEGLRVLDADEDGESDLEAAEWPSDQEEEDLIPLETNSAVVNPPSTTRLGHPVNARGSIAATQNEHISASTIAQQAIPTLPAKFAPISPAKVRLAETSFSKLFSAITPSKLRSKPQEVEGSITTALSIEELLRQRKAKLEAAAAKSASQTVVTQQTGDPKHTAARSVATTKPLVTSAQNDRARSSTKANAMAHFGQFLTLQGQPNAPVIEEAIIEEVEAANMADTLPATIRSATSTDISTASAEPIAPSIQIVTPIIENRKQKISAVLSDTVMEDRYLVLKLQEHLPCLEIVVRDHALQTGEADITVSAGIGLITTNLQKLKQKALPGHKAVAGIRERVASVATRYERLIVLVSEGKQALGEQYLEVSGIDERDILVLSDFIGQCSLIETEVQIQYIPGGDEELFHWLAAAIARYGGGQDFKLCQEETDWERFLRKAGLNTFAAQLVLRQLTVPDDDHAPSTPARSGHLSGLAAFLCMREEERVQQFGPLIGGEGMLRRASRALDGRWPSAANVSADASWTK